MNISSFSILHNQFSQKFVHFKKKKSSHLFEGKTRGISEITAFSSKQWMWLVPNYEHDIRRYFTLRLITFFLKCDFRARLPTRLHRYAHIFIFLFRCAIWLHYTSRYFHLLHTTTVNFFKRHVQIMLNRRILNFLFLERCVNIERM